jgi:RHS repeat-associated protein
MEKCTGANRSKGLKGLRVALCLVALLCSPLSLSLEIIVAAVIIDAATDDSPPPPPPPTPAADLNIPSLSLSTTDSREGQWTVSWSASPGATTYSLEEAAGSGVYGEVARLSGLSTTIFKTVDGDYHYRVRACNNTLCSKPSVAQKVRLVYTPASSLNLPSESASGSFTVRWHLATPVKSVLLQRTGPDRNSWQSISSQNDVRQLNLAPGDYQYRLVRYLHDGRRINEQAKTVRVSRPAAPILNPVPAQSSGRLTVSWQTTHYTDDYQLQQSRNGGGYSPLPVVRNASTALNLAPGNYRYRVRACRGGNQDRHCGEWGDSDVTEVVMATPSVRLQRTYNDSGHSLGYQLSWHRVDHADRYVVHRVFNSGSAQLVYQGNQLSLRDTLSDGRYQYNVVACHEGYCSESAYVRRDIVTPPDTPVGVGISNHSTITDGSYTLYWSPQLWRVTDYKIHRERAIYGSDSYTPDTVQNPTGTTTQLDYQAGDGHYRYRLQACNEAGCSGLSAPVTVSVLAVPDQPERLAVIDKDHLSDHRYSLDWSQGSTRRGQRITHYQLQSATAVIGGQFSTEQSQTIDASLTRYGVEVAQGQYRYRVRACNEAGCSAYTAVASTQVLFAPSRPHCAGHKIIAGETFTLAPSETLRMNGNLVVEGMVAGGPAQLSVHNLVNEGLISDTVSVNSVGSGCGLRVEEQATSTDDNYVLRWDSQGPEVSYRVYRQRADYGSDHYGEAVLILQTTNTYATESVADGNYRYHIQACNAAGCSLLSASVERLVLRIPTVPTNLRLSDRSHAYSGDYSLHWDTQEGRVTHYQLYRGQASYGLYNYDDDQLLSAHTALSMDQSVSEGEYRYRLRACNESGCSALSDYLAVSVLTTPEAPTELQLPTASIGSFAITLNQGDARVEGIRLQQSTDNGVTWQQTENFVYANNALSLSRATVFTEEGTVGRYSFRIALCNRSGCSAYSEVPHQIEITPPGTPADFSVAISHTEGATYMIDAQGNYTLNWQGIGAITLGDQLHQVYYQLQRRTHTDKPWQAVSLSDKWTTGYTGTATATAYTFYRLKACLTETNCGSWTRTLTLARTPSAVDTLTLPGTNSSGDYAVTWQTATGTVEHYQIERNGLTLASELQALHYAQTALEDGLYRYRLRACNQVVCGPWSAEQTAEVRHTPSAPQGLSGDTRSDSRGTYWLSWLAPESSRVTLYQLTADDHWSQAITINSGHEYRFNAQPDGQYSYRVRACNPFSDGQLNCGAPSASHLVQVRNAPVVPTLMASETSSLSGTYNLYWLAQTSDIQPVPVADARCPQWLVTPQETLRLAEGETLSTGGDMTIAQGAMVTGSANTQLHASRINNAGILDTRINIQSADCQIVHQSQTSHTTDYNYQLLENNRVLADNLRATGYAVHKRDDGLYTYHLRACNAVGCSDLSAPVDVQVWHSPGVVRQLQAEHSVTGATGSLTLSWQAPVEGTVSYYEMRRTQGDTQRWSPSDDGQLWFSQTLSYEAIEGDHDYWLRACNALSCGDEVRYTLKVRLAPTSPAVINGPGVSQDGNYRLSWQAGSGTITGYQLQQRQQTDRADNWQLVSEAKALSYEISEQTAGQYAYRLRACNDNSCGDWSAIKPVTVDRYEVPSPTPLPTASDPGAAAGSDQIGSLAGQFRVSETGAASYSIPIAVAAGTAGVAPNLSLSYNSRSGNGLLGKGWRLNGLGAIVRCRQTRVQDGRALPIAWDAQDRFCLNGQRLLVISGDYGAPNSQYKTEIDQFSVVTAVGGTVGNPDSFNVEGKDGSISVYGNSPAAKQTTAQGHYNWAISRMADSVGNGIDFDYHNDDAGQRIAEINYAYGNGHSANARVVFSYQARADQLQGYIAGYPFNTGKRLTSIKTYNRHGGGETLLRDYRLSYADTRETVPGVARASRIISLRQCSGDGSCLPATEFTWQQADSHFAKHSDGNTSIDVGYENYLLDSQFADINGDGLQDLIYVTSDAKYKYSLLHTDRWWGKQTLHTMINTGEGFVHGEAKDYRVADVTFQPLKPQVLDYNADGRQDVLVYDQNQGWSLLLAVAAGDGYWSLQRQASISLPFSSADIAFADINGDGLADAFTGNHYWPLVRDPSKDNSDNLAYHFADKQTIQCNGCGTTVDVKSTAGDLNGDGIVDFLISKDKVSYQLIVSDARGPSLDYQLIGNNSADAISDPSLFRAADINGDGLTDILYWNKQQNQWHMQLSTGAGLADSDQTIGDSSDHSDSPSTLAFLGIEVPALRLPVDLIEVPINSGGLAGYTVSGSTSNGSVELEQPIDSAAKQGVQIADINRDGYGDILWQQDNQLKIRYWSNSTQTFSDASDLKAIEQGDKINHILMDYNGDGAVDHVQFSGRDNANGGTFTYHSSGDAATDRWDAKRNIDQVITQIKNGLGALTQFDYQRINQSDHYSPIEPDVSTCDWQQTCDYHNDNRLFNDPFGDLPAEAQSLQHTPISAVLPLNGALPVVSRVSSSAPLADDPAAKSHISYYYAAARMQAIGHGFIGFKQLRTVDEQSGVQTTTSYRQDWPFIGSPWKTSVKTATGELLTQTTTTWALQGWQGNWPDQFKHHGSVSLGALQPYIARSEQHRYGLGNQDRGTGALLATQITHSQYDPYGNATEIINETRNGAGNLESKQTTTHRYGDTEQDRQKGRLSYSQVVAERPGQGTKTKQSRFSYYSSGHHQGLLHTETIEGDQSQQQTLTHSYDTYGNRTQSITQGWDGQQTATRHGLRNVYDHSGRYITHSYQQYPGLGEQLTRQVISRNAYGSPTVVEDSLGNRAYSYYSPAGRQYFSHSDTGGWQQTQLATTSAECPVASTYVTHTTHADGSASQQCYDLLARVIRSLTRGFDGRWIASDTQYDNRGRSIATSLPFAINSGSDSAAYWNRIDYDLLDRPVQVTAPDGNISYSHYNGLDTVAINPQGQRKTQTHNSLGEVISVTDNLGGQTHYSHDAMGQLVHMTDPAGNQTRIVYDALGRKLSINDPDKGQWRYSYNAFGELIAQTDAKGQTTTTQYDSLGRTTQRIDKHSHDGIEQTTRWHYDSRAHGLGQLARVENSHGYRLVPDYDSLGRNYQTHTTVPGAGTFTERQTFDHLGRIWQRFDASSGRDNNGVRGLQTEYNPYGYASAVTDVRHRHGQPITTYQRIHQMDANGHVIHASIGNDMIHSKKQYDYATGLLQQINSQGPLGDQLQNLQYQWDTVGNLSYRSDHSGDKNLQERFTYDGLNRLVYVDSNHKQLSLSYDALGNISYKSDVGHYSYGYGNQGGNSAGPHAVTKAGDITYEYDANGNNIHSSDGRTLSYSTFDKVIAINQGAHQVTFAYGPDRSRYQRTDSDSNTGDSKTTYYLGAVELIDYTAGSRAGEREYKRQLGNAIETLSYKDGSLQSQTTHYLLHDHLGSVDVITDQAGNRVQQLSFDAWGQRRNGKDWQTVLKDAQSKALRLSAFSPINQITNRGYTGHEMIDGVDIIHMNGRIYDAKLARFLQADPIIQAPYNTQSLNRYSYVWNNPLNATDPSGFVAENDYIDNGYECVPDPNYNWQDPQPSGSTGSGSSEHADVMDKVSDPRNIPEAYWGRGAQTSYWDEGPWPFTRSISWPPLELHQFYDNPSFFERIGRMLGKITLNKGTMHARALAKSNNVGAFYGGRIKIYHRNKNKIIGDYELVQLKESFDAIFSKKGGVYGRELKNRVDERGLLVELNDKNLGQAYTGSGAVTIDLQISSSTLIEHSLKPFSLPRLITHEMIHALMGISDENTAVHITDKVMANIDGTQRLQYGNLCVKGSCPKQPSMQSLYYTWSFRSHMASYRMPSKDH